MSKKKNEIKTRDHLMVKVINGVTKAGIHTDEKKEASKQACREEEEVYLCFGCGDELGSPDRFCSDKCELQFKKAVAKDG